jgi:tight adherence protein C
MMDLIYNLATLETLITILVMIASFATVLTVAAPFMENDELKARMKLVSAERDRLKSRQRAQMSGTESKLRDKSSAGLARQVVDTLGLRRVFEVEPSRDLLKQAGLRKENHLVTYLALRLASPIGIAVLAYIYSATIFEDLAPNLRLAITVGAALFGFYLPVIMLKNRVQRRQESIQRAWPDALDLMLICVESGLAIEPALQRVAREIGPSSVPLAEELTLTVAELSFLQERRKAFENLGKRTGLQTVKSVVTSLVQSERYGTPLGTALRVLAQENRDQRMFTAERKAAALPPRLTVPMIAFFLPVIFVVILGPSVLKLMNMD